MIGQEFREDQDYLVIWAVKLPTLMGGALACLAGFPISSEVGVREAKTLDQLHGATGWRHVVGTRARPPFRVGR